MELLKWNTTNFYVSGVADYAFVVALNRKEMVVNGGLWVEWPQEFSNGTAASTCKVVYGSTTLTNCSWTDYSGFLRSEVPLPAAPYTLATPITITFKGITNPKEAFLASGFSLKYLDWDLGQVIARTETSSLNFTPAVFSIYSNVSYVEVIKGTFSELVQVKLEAPAPDSVKIEPRTDCKGVLFEPMILEFKHVTRDKAWLRIGITEQAQPQVCTVTFLLFEAYPSRLFSPPPNLELKILPCQPLFPVLFTSLLPFPAGSTSLSVIVTLARPLAFGNLYIDLQANTTELVVSPGLLTFRRGDQALNFTVTSGIEASDGLIKISMQKASDTPYYLPVTELEVTILQGKPNNTEIVGSEVGKVGRTEAVFEANFSAPTTIYYAIGLYGESTPALQNLKEGKSNRLICNAILISTKAAFGLYNAQISLKSLKAQVKYALFFTFSGSASEVPYNISFTTAPPLPAVSFIITTLTFYEVPSPSAITVYSAVQRVLAVHPQWLQYIANPDNIGRTLSVGTSHTFILNIDPEVDIGEPGDLVKSLDLRKSLLHAYLPTLDTSKTIYDSITSLKNDTPHFLSSPKLIHSDETSLTISVIMDQSGRIHGVLVDRNDPKPLAQQIRAGWTANNTEVPAEYYQSVTCISHYLVKLRFTGLEKYRRYAVWLAGENDLPGFPMSMLDKDVRAVLATTGKATQGVMGIEVLLSDEGWRAIIGLLAVLAWA
jgi:hypothetical protein